VVAVLMWTERGVDVCDNVMTLVRLLRRCWQEQCLSGLIAVNSQESTFKASRVRGGGLGLGWG
jgi:hypothetical protein